MLLKVKSINLYAGKPIVILTKKTARKMNVHVSERVNILYNNKEINAVIDLVERGIEDYEVALSEEAILRLGIKKGEFVEIQVAPMPKSVKYILKKLNGQKLNKEEIHSIIRDIVNNSLTEPEIAYFVSSVYTRGMNFQETTDLIDAIVSTGNRLNIKGKIVDKHSIGGLAGNRTTPIIIPICCAAGLIMPKTSSRAITSAAGTADVIETLAEVEFSSVEDIERIVNKTGGCMVWGGALGLAPADDKIIQIERLLSLDPEPQLLASIIAKKISVGARYVLIDIPFGKHAKVDKKDALSLSKKFTRIGKHFGIEINTILTNGEQPIGNGIGPVLEMRDVLRVLKREEERPIDLEKKAVLLSGKILEMAGKAKRGKGIEMAQKILDSKRAYKKFEEIIIAQNGKIDESKLKPAKINYEFIAENSGTIREIENKTLNHIARFAGCPMDKSAGIYLAVHTGQKVRKDDVLFIIYAESQRRLSYAVRLAEMLNPIKID